MKYAVPVSGGKISSHFGHCRRFTFFEVNEQTKTVNSQEQVEAPEHQPGLLPVWLAKNNTEVVIACRMGERARDLLERSGINVVAGVQESDPEQAVIKHLNGNLATTDMVCDHGQGKRNRLNR